MHTTAIKLVCLSPAGYIGMLGASPMTHQYGASPSASNKKGKDLKVRVNFTFYKQSNMNF